MTQWSGLAPAVDAHLSYWARTERAIELARRVDSERSPESLVAWADNEWGNFWTRFASSYGTPDGNGVPMAHSTPMDESTISGPEQHRAEGVAVWQSARLAMREHEMLTKAISHYVSADVVAEITEAAGMAHDEPLFDTDVFTPYGFAVLEEPLVAPDLDPITGVMHPSLEVHIRAIGWKLEERIGSTDPDDQVYKPGVSVFCYTTPEDYAEGYYTTAIDAGFEVMFGPDEIRDGFTCVEVMAWSFGRPWSARNTPAHEHGTVPEPMAYMRRWFYAFMRLCWQKVVVPQRQTPKRGEGRRWERQAKRKELLDYTVLRLRRLSDPGYTSSGLGVPLDHRVLVRHHWKQQYFPSMGPARLEDGSMNPHSHRWTWIEAHWRGPEDGPVGAMEWATSVVR